MWSHLDPQMILMTTEVTPWPQRWGHWPMGSKDDDNGPWGNTFIPEVMPLTHEVTSWSKDNDGPWGHNLTPDVMMLTHEVTSWSKAHAHEVTPGPCRWHCWPTRSHLDPKIMLTANEVTLCPQRWQCWPTGSHPDQKMTMVAQEVTPWHQRW